MTRRCEPVGYFWTGGPPPRYPTGDAVEDKTTLLAVSVSDSLALSEAWTRFSCTDIAMKPFS